MIVKKAENERDAGDLMILCRNHHAEFEKNAPFDEMYTYFNALDMANNSAKTGSHIWMAYDGALPVGYLVATIGPYLFSKKLRADQHLWYVAPEHRKSRAAYMLFSAFEDFARDAGCLEVVAGVEMDDIEFSDRISTLFPRMGFKRTGSVFNKVIEDNNG